MHLLDKHFFINYSSFIFFTIAFYSYFNIILHTFYETLMKYNFLFFLHFELYRKPVCNLVVSLPILTVIPIILLATVDTSFRKNGHKKTDFSRHEKSTNHFWLMLSNYFVFVNIFNCVSTSRPPYITRIIVTTCVSSSGIYKTRYMLQAYQADHLHFLVSAIQKQCIRRFHEGLSRPNLKSRYNKS